MEFPETKDMSFPDKIQSERLVLQKVKKDDEKLAKEVVKAIQEAKENQATFYPFSKKDTLKDIVDYFNWEVEAWDNFKMFRYIIRNRKTKEFLDYIGLHSFTKWNKTAELDYWLKMSATGKGYCSESLEKMEKLAFTNGVGRLVLKIDSLNKRSNQFAKRNGYHLDGVLRQDSYISDLKIINDTNFYTKLKAEWKNKSEK